MNNSGWLIPKGVETRFFRKQQQWRQSQSECSKQTYVPITSDLELDPGTWDVATSTLENTASILLEFDETSLLCAFPSAESSDEFVIMSAIKNNIGV